MLIWTEKQRSIPPAVFSLACKMSTNSLDTGKAKLMSQAYAQCSLWLYQFSDQKKEGRPCAKGEIPFVDSLCERGLRAWTTDYSEYSRLEMTIFFRTLSDDGIFGPVCLGVRVHATLSTPLHSSYVVPSSPSRAKLARENYLYSPTSLLYPSPWPGNASACGRFRRS